MKRVDEALQQLKEAADSALFPPDLTFDERLRTAVRERARLTKPLPPPRWRRPVSWTLGGVAAAAAVLVLVLAQGGPAPQPMAIGPAGAVEAPAPAAPAPTEALRVPMAARAEDAGAPEMAAAAAADEPADTPAAADLPPLPPQPAGETDSSGPDSPSVGIASVEGPSPGVASAQTAAVPALPPVARIATQTAREHYAFGEPVQLTVEVANVAADTLQLPDASPYLVVRSLADRQTVYRSSLAELRGLRLPRAERFVLPVTWHEPERSGWYSAEIQGVTAYSGERAGAVAGQSARFFIEYPADSLQLGNVDVDAVASLHGYTLHVQRVEFLDRQTLVFVQIRADDRPLPRRGELYLVRDDRRQMPVAPVVWRRVGDELAAMAEFEPTPLAVSSLSLTLDSLQVGQDGQPTHLVRGPWQVSLSTIAP